MYDKMYTMKWQWVCSPYLPEGLHDYILMISADHCRLTLYVRTFIRESFAWTWREMNHPTQSFKILHRQEWFHPRPVPLLSGRARGQGQSGLKINRFEINAQFSIGKMNQVYQEGWRLRGFWTRPFYLQCSSFLVKLDAIEIIWRSRGSAPPLWRPHSG